MLQNDTGSTIVYGAFFFVLYREGLPKYYLTILVSIILIAVFALKFGAIITSVLATIVIFGNYYLNRKKTPILQPIFIFVMAIGLAFGVKYFYNAILKPHQQDRITLWLRLEKDPIKLEKMKKNLCL